MPLGMKLAPAFACTIAAEIVQLLTAMGIRCCQYVDDLLCSGATRQECQKNMDTAMEVLRWLGFTCNPDKTTGPAPRLKYIGYIIDADAGTARDKTWMHERSKCLLKRRTNGYWVSSRARYMKASEALRLQGVDITELSIPKSIGDKHLRAMAGNAIGLGNFLRFPVHQDLQNRICCHLH